MTRVKAEFIIVALSLHEEQDLPSVGTSCISSLFEVVRTVVLDFLSPKLLNSRIHQSKDMRVKQVYGNCWVSCSLGPSSSRVLRLGFYPQAFHRQSVCLMK